MLTVHHVRQHREFRDARAIRREGPLETDALDCDIARGWDTEEGYGAHENMR
jgi:hypothetical protein